MLHCYSCLIMLSTTFQLYMCASDRLEMAMGSGLAPFTTQQSSSPRDIAAVAEMLSALRLRYEETVVRLYSCQRSVSAILRDAAGNTEDAWETVRHEFAGALESTTTGGTDEELWREADRLVNSLANGSSSRETVDTSSSPVQQEHSPGSSSRERGRQVYSDSEMHLSCLCRFVNKENHASSRTFPTWRSIFDLKCFTFPQE